eukprot:TRINITY_DN31378_c0_g1_i1.p1 TRINITY_DN31378_c0_g1~~TRINITY_DN31378_c0_g1_i1.p1  ORF type:complete len:327 (+),score=80.73 TRINITY_DN31378_c0_g1_i1:85-1065(+)
MAPAETPGSYVVVRDDLPVTQELDRGSAELQRLPAGTPLEVLEVAGDLDDGRVRARVAEPSGWISMRSGSTLFVRAEGAGADPALPSCASWQRTSLMIAARHGQADVIARALETSCAGAASQLDAVDEAGNTALMIAAREGHAEVVEVLAAAGADLSLVDVQGRTAAELASTEEVRKALKAASDRYDSLVAAVLGGAGSSSAGAAAAGASSGSGSAGAAGGAGDLCAELAAAIAAEASALKASSPFATNEAPGRFAVTREGLPVNAEFSRESPEVTTLAEGTEIRIAEVPLKLDTGCRVRARLEEPVAGWITLRSGAKSFARRIGD